MSEILNFFSFIIFFTTATNIHSDTALQLTRSERFFPLFSVVRFANSECSGTNSFNGTCFTRKECYNYKGTASGTCANGLGTCCTFKKECGSVTTLNNTYFVNPGYYSSYEGGERCTITVYRCNSDVCQLRIDFMEFNLAQPNASGVCDNDFLLISGSASTVPRICGENNNQHLYVDFNGANPITISVDTNTDYAFARKWNLRLQQIACDSPWRAPNGCLQYYKTITGTVTSFNYGTTTNSRVSTPLLIPGTRQMQNLNYGVCIRMALGYCTIEWSQSDTLSFTVSGDSGILDGTPGIDYSVSGELCTHNFVIVPNPSTNGSRDTTDRFCGNGFQTKQSSSKPFVLYVVTNQDPNENQPATDDLLERDFANRGFVLKYRQLACAV
ncbi:uncharacterized protein LOC103579154 [Microplitis demolitor]|uniref:uncharacterized protein LOC103579154 n=1 Tax=Microplitis demolitor TaxID=69319 RepID=UPI0004CDB777|nr:uncharacterized protein LOC103579154 [Microplitis demolitor]